MLVGVPVSFGIAVFSPRCAAHPEATTSAPPLSCLLRFIDHLRHVGLFVFAPLFAETLQPLMINTLGKLPLVGILFQGTLMGFGVFTAG